MLENIITYSPLIVVVTVFYLQQKIFVTPADLEKKHREINHNAFFGNIKILIHVN